MRKKICSVLCLCFLLTGCGQGGPTPEEEAYNAQCVLMQAFIDNDADTIYNEMCQAYKDNYSVDDIKEVLSHFDGNVVSYEEPKFYPQSNSYNSENGKMNNFLDNEIDNVTTDSGHDYEVYFSYCNVNDFAPDEVGITSFSLRSTENEDPSNSIYNTSYGASIWGMFDDRGNRISE